MNVTMPEPLTQQELEKKLANSESLQGVEIGNVDFSNHCFEKEPNFSGAVFTGRADFDSTHFLNGANFSAAHFSSNTKTYFHKAQFSGHKMANFCGTKFSSNAGTSFVFAQFSGDEGVQFSFAQFSGQGRAHFNAATFFCNGGASFYRTQFFCERGADFSGSKFLGLRKTIFEGTNFKENKPIWFERIEMDSPGNLEFDNISNLGCVFFRKTDLEKISFKSVHFRKIHTWFFTREVLADESRNIIVADDDSEKKKYDHNYYNQVEILYRKLKLNFETQRDYSRAGDFHYGEMEMKRKWKTLEWEEKPISKFIPFLKYFNLTQCYKIISGYGEKWQQALASFVAVWMIFTGLNLFWIEPKTTMPREQTTQMEKWEKDSLHRVSGSALFSFKVLTLQRWSDDFQLKGTSYLPGFFVALQHLIGPTIIALMLLAIRRQFRR